MREGLRLREEESLRRCAVYTRKSHEDGLEQDFNSLDAQREACEAFIRSQAARGWRLAPGRYDDGGFSGGTMERPAPDEGLACFPLGIERIEVLLKTVFMALARVDGATAKGLIVS